MDELLANVLDAHGGLENWNRVTKLTARVTLGGPFWAARGWPDVYAEHTETLDPRREHITFSPFTAPDRRSVLEVNPERVTIQTTEGRVVEERTNPRASFPMPFVWEETPWDAIQVAYFTSAALWNYLTQPFSLSYEGVEAHEVEPWEEGSELWRRLAVTFPASNANHNADQVVYYDENFLIRRMDYAPDVTGNPPVAHYIHDLRTFDGFVFPTRRLVHLHDADGAADQSKAGITIDVASVALERLQ